MLYTLFLSAVASFSFYQISKFIYSRLNAAPAPVPPAPPAPAPELLPPALVKIIEFCKTLNVPDDIIKNMSENYKTYDEQCYDTSAQLKRVDFDRLSSDYFELPEGTRILVQALLLKQLESENFVNQFNAIHSLTVFANSFEDYINSHAPSSSEEPEEDDFEKAIRISREEAKKRNFEEDKAVVPPVKPVASPVKPVAPPVEKKKAESVISSEPAVQEDQPSPQDIRIKVLLLRTYLISEDEVSDCMQALKTQKSWKDAFTALKAYDDSTKDYSAKGLIAFIAEGSKSDAILSAFRNQAAATAVLLDQTKKDEKLSTKASRP